MNRELFYKIIKKIMSIDSPSGYTDRIVDYIKSFVKALGFNCYKSNKGNLIIEINSSNDKKALALSAHVDTLGLMVRSINNDGTLAITKIGGPIMPTLDGEYCKVYTRSGKIYSGTIISSSPSIHVYKDSTSIKRDEDTMLVRLDEVVKNKEDVLALDINSGDFIAYDPKTVISDNGFIKSRFLDDKLSIAIILTLLHEIATNKLVLDRKIYILISTYEEVGHGCAWIPKDIETLLAIDMGCVGMDLNCDEYSVSICAKDSSGPYDYNIVNALIDLAKKHQLNYAVDIYPFYGSDVSSALRGGSDIKGALIGPGVAASHGMERTHIKAVENTYNLLKYYLDIVK